MPGQVPTPAPTTGTWPLTPVHMKQIRGAVRMLPKFAPWALGLGAAAGWMVYPALTEKFKSSPFGLFDDDSK